MLNFLSRILAGALLPFGAASAAAVLLVTTEQDSCDGQCNLHCSLVHQRWRGSQPSERQQVILLPSGTHIADSAQFARR
jgi:hypothetical protein